MHRILHILLILAYNYAVKQWRATIVKLSISTIFRLS